MTRLWLDPSLLRKPGCHNDAARPELYSSDTPAVISSVPAMQIILGGHIRLTQELASSLTQ